MTLYKRRDILRFIALGGASLALPEVSWGKTKKNLAPSLPVPQKKTFYIPLASEVRLNFYNIHTGETLKNCTFIAQGKHIPEEINRINHFFRDHRTNEKKSIDLELLVFLWHLQTSLGSSKPLDLISGYRSPKTNTLLRQQSCGVAKNSRHLLGQAADINLPGRLKDIHRFAKKYRRGGVGLYRNFVHVDIGPVRFW